MKKETSNVLCPNCIFNGTIGNISICNRPSPDWDVIDNKFMCNDYVAYKEKKDDEKKKLR